MRAQHTLDPRRYTHWKRILVINIALGLLLSLLSLTNLSLPGAWPNVMIPPLLGIMAFILLRRFILPSVTGKIHLLAKLSTLPAIGFGCLPSFLMLCMIIPPFTLGFLFAMGEMVGERHIQSAVSPDGTRVAEVYFRGVGAYSGGNGRITVRVHPRVFPLVEWDVYSNSHSTASEASQNYLSWIDNQDLLISEDPEKVLANQFYFSPDPGFAIPILLIKAVSQISGGT